MKKSSKLIKIRFLQQNIFLKVCHPRSQRVNNSKNQYVSGIVKYDLLFYMI